MQTKIKRLKFYTTVCVHDKKRKKKKENKRHNENIYF